MVSGGTRAMARAPRKAPPAARVTSIKSKSALKRSSFRKRAAATAVPMDEESLLVPSSRAGLRPCAR